ncbi:MAG: hypothetical protein ACYCSO_01610 [Cuniculiplasma sp.]
MAKENTKWSALLSIFISLITLFFVIHSIGLELGITTVLLISIILIIYVVGSFLTKMGAYVSIFFAPFILSIIYFQISNPSDSPMISVSLVTLFTAIMGIVTWLFVILTKNDLPNIKREKGSRSQEKEISDVMKDLEYLEIP